MKEELSHIKVGDARKHLPFPHNAAWRGSTIMGGRWTPYFISTKGESPNRVIRVHQDGGSSGKPRPLPASSLPRTALSATNAAESPTATVARREMQSWRLLRLEPSALREPDSFSAPAILGTDGAHLPAALYHLARPGSEKTSDEGALRVYSQIANRLSELIDDVREVKVDRDEKRELLTLTVTGRDGTCHPARSLSDGTLRFLALAMLELAPEARGLLCLEEPENGIHPERIPAMLRLLQDIVTDPRHPTDADNPLRQVIINTHSPTVVAQVPDDSLLMAELREMARGKQIFRRLSFSCLPKTWRQEAGDCNIVSRGRLIAYLNPVSPALEDATDADDGFSSPKRPERQRMRVVDRPDLQGDLDLAPGAKIA